MRIVERDGAPLVGIDGRFGFKGGPTLSGRTANACDYEDAQKLWDFAESETDTTFPLRGQVTVIYQGFKR